MLFSDIPCVIFAGGKSSRMGQNKALLPFAGTPSLAQFQYERLQAFFHNVYLSAKDLTPFEDFSPQGIPESIAKDVFAPTVGFVNAFNALADTHIFILSVDSPLVGREVLEKFSSVNKTEYDAIIARTDEGIHPLCGIYSAALAPRFVEMLENNEHKLKVLLDSVRVKYIDVDDIYLTNVNTPAEYTNALELYSTH